MEILTVLQNMTLQMPWCFMVMELKLFIYCRKEKNSFCLPCFGTTRQIGNSYVEYSYRIVYKYEYNSLQIQYSWWSRGTVVSAHRTLAKDFQLLREMSNWNSICTVYLKYIGLWPHLPAKVQIHRSIPDLANWDRTGNIHVIHYILTKNYGFWNMQFFKVQFILSGFLLQPSHSSILPFHF